jgi:uncharacterized phage protein (TIGR01671 family)
MREIRFRAWDKRGLLMFYNIQNGITFDDESHYKFSEFVWDSERWEVMQYTGLTDSKGTPIFEGDILEECLYIAWCDKDKSYTPHLSTHTEANKCLQCAGDYHWYDIVADDQVEVIGNIYEHPHLLDNNDKND